MRRFYAKYAVENKMYIYFSLICLKLFEIRYFSLYNLHVNVDEKYRQETYEMQKKVKAKFIL